MLAEDYELDGDVEEDEDCGCLVSTIEVDGFQVEVHHWLPDDFAPHAPESECGCCPVLHDQRPKRLLYEHLDQDTEEGCDAGFPAAH